MGEKSNDYCENQTKNENHSNNDASLTLGQTMSNTDHRPPQVGESGSCYSTIELNLQTLPPEIMSLILSFVGDEELWKLRNLCHAFKSVYESSVRLKFYRLLPHVKAEIEKLRETVENSHFSLERLRLSLAKKMLLLKYAYREALMFSTMIWRQSFDPEAWPIVCHAASSVIDEFYAFADHNVHAWGRFLDLDIVQNRFRAWNAFQTTFTTKIEPNLTEQRSTPFSTQVLDVLDCATHANWQSNVQIHPGTDDLYNLDYFLRLRNDSRVKSIPSENEAWREFSVPNKKASILRFLRKSISDNTIAEFNRILKELEPLEQNVARTFGYDIPDTMVAEMSRVYARVFQEYPFPWPVLKTLASGFEVTRAFDYELTQSWLLVKLNLSFVQRRHLPLSLFQESLKERIRFVLPLKRLDPPPPLSVAGVKGARTGKGKRGRGQGRGRAQGQNRRGSTLCVETTKPNRRNRLLKNCITVRAMDEDFRVTTRLRVFVHKPPPRDQPTQR